MCAEMAAALNTMVLVGDLLRLNHAGEAMYEALLQRLVDEQTGGAAVASKVLTYAPAVRSGETADAYGDRLLAEVRRRRGAGAGGR